MIIGYEIVVGFLMGFLGSIPLAGPVALLVMTRGLSREFHQAGWIAGGASLAEGIMAACAFAGVGMIYERFPDLERVFQWLGVAVLIGVGAWFWVRGMTRSKPSSGPEEAQGGGFGALLLGFGLVIGNPGMIGTWGGAIAAIEATGMLAPEALRAPGFGLGVCAGVFSWFLLLLKLISKYGDIITASALHVLVRWIGFILCVAGVVAGIALLLAE
jgi:threonine/homoserine/homoserine lactone efflux protein